MRGLVRSVSIAAILLAGSAARAADPQVKAAEPPAKQGTAQFPDLIGALKATPGCLGVETAKTDSGKSVIFAWFEDKKAVLKFYYSDTHQQVMKQFFPESDGSHKPLAHVPDDSGPIMMIASVTFNAKPTKDDPSPFKQIAIEVYQPLKGGLAIGGSFAPKAMKVPAPKFEKKDEKK
jgi:quinol monooxygenase YgiN